MNYLLVFLGAGVGGALRQGVNTLAARYLGTHFPFGTLTVNILGSFLMGLLTAIWLHKSGLPQPLRLFLTTGMLGGFTTFSTFSLDTATLFERGATGTAIGYVVLSFAVSLLAVFAGLACIRVAAPA